MERIYIITYNVASLILSILTITIPLTAQSSRVVNTILASTNLAAPIDSKAVTNSNSSISGSSKTSCMEAFAFSGPDGTLKIKSHSDKCGAVHKPHAAASWLVDFLLTGNNNQNIPLTFNFGFTASTEIQSLAQRGCISIAAVDFSGEILSDGKKVHSIDTEITYQDGAIVKYLVSGLDAKDAYASLKLGISLQGKDQILNEIPPELVKQFFAEYYSRLPTQEQSLNKPLVDMINSGAPLTELQLATLKLPESYGTLLNMLKSFGIFDKMNIQVGDSKVGLTAKILINYNFTRKVTVTTSQAGYLYVLIQAINATTVCEETVANLDATNTFKLLSITVPDNFYNPLVNVDDLRVEWGTQKYPVTYESKVVGTKNLSTPQLKAQISPNPVSSSTTLMLDKPCHLQKIEILSLSGQVVKAKNYNKVIAKLEIENLHLPSGIYALRVYCKEGNGVIKMVVP